MISNFWEFNFMGKQTQFQNIDNYFIKYNILFYFKIMQV